MRGLYWIRSDLRIHDNSALSQFCKECSQGLIFWSATKSYLRADEKRKLFIDECVESFNLEADRFGQFIFKSTDILEIKLVVEKYQIEKVFFTSEYCPEEIAEEIYITEVCKKLDVAVESFDQQTLIAEKNLPFALEDMPFIFTEFRKKVEFSLAIERIVESPKIWPKKFTEKQIQKTVVNHLKSDELAGLERSIEYIWKTESIRTYKETRNGLLNRNDSSKFSPWLSQGCLSPRRIYFETKKFESNICANDSTYWLIFELLWRDYFKFFAKKYRKKLFLERGIQPNINYKPLADKATFAQWCQGQTQEPFINAFMLELNATGFMSNRGRQNVASYLIHDLKQPWTWGAHYFEKKLIDYDASSNWGNWLYLSGNGSDPRARKFNIPKQAAQYDPEQLFQRRWLT